VTIYCQRYIDFPPILFEGRQLAKNNRKNSSSPFFYGKAVSQEKHGDFQPFLFTGRQLSNMQEQKYCPSNPFFSGGSFGQQKPRGSSPLFSGGSATRNR
jgi:hypothetical protein